MWLNALEKVSEWTFPKPVRSQVSKIILLARGMEWSNLNIQNMAAKLKTAALTKTVQHELHRTGFYATI